MTVKITILGDTHIRNFEELPREMMIEIEDSDWVIHVGDYVSLDVLEGLIKLKGDRFKGVYGNADPKDIRNRVNTKEVIEISGKKIGITHPACGGPSEIIETQVLTEFNKVNVDIIIYGHTHEAKISQEGNTWLINPGKGYLETNYFGPPTTIVILKVDEKIRGDIKEINS